MKTVRTSEQINHSDMDDPEVLQALDEANDEWVLRWKKESREKR
jgi:hypothetical protein